MLFVYCTYMWYVKAVNINSALIGVICFVFVPFFFIPRGFLIDNSYFNFYFFSRMGNYCGNKSYTITLYIIVLEDIFIPLLEM